MFWPHVSDVLLLIQRSFTLATFYLSWHSPPSLKLGRLNQPLADLRAAEVGAALPSESSCIYSEVLPRGCCSCFSRHVGCLPSTLTWYIQGQRFSCESKNGDWCQGGQYCANYILFYAWWQTVSSTRHMSCHHCDLLLLQTREPPQSCAPPWMWGCWRVLPLSSVTQDKCVQTATLYLHPLHFLITDSAGLKVPCRSGCWGLIRPYCTHCTRLFRELTDKLETCFLLLLRQALNAV